MALEIRAVESQEMAEFLRISGLSLGRSQGTLDALRPEWTLAGFENGKLASTYGAWPLTMRFNGGGLPVAGVTAVSTHPLYRRRGHIRALTSAHFQLLHQQGERPIAVLNASMAAIYHRYDYAVVSTQHAYNVEPQYLQFPRPTPVHGDFREANEEDFPLLVDLYRRFREERTCYVHRGRAMWDAGVLAPAPPGGHLVTLIYQQDGEPQGYVIYCMESIQGGTPGFARQRITVRDLIWLTPGAYQAIWNHFQPMDLVDSISWGRIPVDDPLPHLLLEPRRLHLTSRDGVMARIVDLETALPQRRYAVQGSLKFEVRDELCPWNAGRWKLETSGAETAVARTDQSPQFVVSVSTLAMLVFGQISASEASRMGLLEALDDKALALADTLFRTAYRPACADIF